MSGRTSNTHVIGPLGSEFWQIRVSPEAVLHMAERKIDWRVFGRRMLIDARAGIISWINPSGPHVGLAEATDDIVKEAEQFLKGRVRGMRDMRWRKPEDPRNTGVEADASFYIGDKAEHWYTTAREQGMAGVQVYELRTPADLIIEVEITNLDEDKPSRYAKLGVREMWQVNLPKNQDMDQIRVTILDLQANGGPRKVEQSQVLPGLTTTNLPEVYRVAWYGTREELQSVLEKELVISEQIKKKEPLGDGPQM